MQQERQKTILQKKLLRMLSPYNEHWRAFTRSPHCFLTENEVRVLELCYKHGSTKTVATIIGWKQFKVSEVLSNSLCRLNGEGVNYYKNWCKENYALENGKKKRVYGRDIFITAPLKSRYFSVTLKHTLSSNADNVLELLSTHGEKQLYRIRGFGEKKMRAFKKLLKAHGCAEMLCYDIENMDNIKQFSW